VPIFLELCLLGLGMGHSLMPLWFELLFVGGLGIAPILWMQWQKPFSIFSLLLLALQPNQLSEEQRKTLRLFKTPANQFLAIGTAIVLTLILWQLYKLAPLTTGLVFSNATRGTGLLVAAIAFFFANLFLQVPVSVLRVLLTGEKTFGAIEPYPVERVAADFTLLGVRVKKILPPPKPSKPVVIRPEAPEERLTAVAPSQDAESSDLDEFEDETLDEALTAESGVEIEREAVLDDPVADLSDQVETEMGHEPIDVPDPADAAEETAFDDGIAEAPVSETNWEEAIETELIISQPADEPDLEEGISEKPISENPAAEDTELLEESAHVLEAHVLELEVITLEGLPETAPTETDGTDGTDDANWIDTDNWSDEEDLHA
jgi:hypothetical protein